MKRNLFSVMFASGGLALVLSFLYPSTGSRPDNGRKQILNAAFLCIDGVYNSELMAPYDIFQHSVFRDSTNFIQPFIVTPDGRPFVTFEGIRITPHYSFENVPRVDILIIPSTKTSMDADLQHATYMSWVKQTVASALYVITVCDGAFPLAATGALNGRVATSFPGDRSRLARMFPEVDVRYDVNFVRDGKYITSVGGALSYEPALYLLEKLTSTESAKRTARGLVLEWDLSKIPHLIVDESSPGDF
ncbi:MAG: DJ-1/PfpI family protein [bacterium]